MDVRKPEEMASFFDVRATTYDQHMRETVASFEEFYDKVSSPIPATDGEIEILDLGCGTGLEIQGILRRVPNARITGIDVSQEMLKQLSERYSGYRTQLNLITGSYTDIDLGANCFDYVVSVMTTHHLLHGEKVKLYERIRKAMKAGGKYIAGDYVVTEEKEKALLADYLRKKGELEPDKLYHIDIPFSLKTEESLSRQAGFNSFEVIWQQGEAAIYVMS